MKFIRRIFARKKPSVHQMFFDRAEKFNKATTAILDSMPQALEAFEEIVQEQEPFKTGGVLRWTEISLVTASLDEPAVVIVGMMTFPIGAEVALATGEKVIVTQDTAQYFPPRLIRIGMPIKLISASKEEIKAYIIKADEEQKKEMEEVKEAVKEALGIDEGTPVPVKTVKKQDSMTTSDDFDLTQLTEDQRQQLVLLSSTKTGRG